MTLVAVPSPRYQRQLSLAAEREQSLEREKVQLGLDWQHRCASVERDQYHRSEELVQGLTAAKEQVCAPGPARRSGLLVRKGPETQRAGRGGGGGLWPRDP